MCDSDVPKAIDPANWREVPFIEGRLATEEDVRCGRAVFYLRGDGVRVANEFPLPALAKLMHEDGTVETVIIIQLEEVPATGVTTAGYRTFEGAFGVATLPEIDIIETSKP